MMPLARPAVISRHVVGWTVPPRPLRTMSNSRLCEGYVQQLVPVIASAAGAMVASRVPVRRSCLRTRQVALMATSASESAQARRATAGDNVLVHYLGTLEDGTVFDSSEENSPLSFVLGRHQVVPGFDKAVLGLRPGEKVSVKLTPDEAYGPFNDELVLTVEADKAPAGLQVGDSVTMRTVDGRGSQALVTKVAQDGSITVDANSPLAGKTLLFDIELVGFKEVLAPDQAPEGMQLATFAAGCFWGVELAFQRQPGVIRTCVGYAQGELEKPSYEDVCAATTGHTEAIRVVYDPSVVSFEELLSTFWERVGQNATTLNQAGNDRGPQYRSGIYYHTEEQRLSAQRSVEELRAKLDMPIVTEVEAAAPFWLAEDHHQQYLEKGGRGGNPQSAEKGCTDTIGCYG